MLCAVARRPRIAADASSDGAASQPTSRSAADEKRSELVREAAALFDREGYHRTSVSDIAAAAGIRKPTLYHYFTGKDEILFWIHEEFIDLLIARHEARQDVPMPAPQALLEVMGDMLDVISTQRGHVRVFFEHFRELPPEQQALVHEKRARYQRYVEDVIRRGVEAGELRPVDVRFATLGLFGMCNWAYQWYRPEGRLRGREVAYLFWDILMRGLESSPEGTEA